MRFILVVLLAYLLGSIPFGYLIVRAKSGSDVRRTGSGGTGATNVSRKAGRSAGALTLVLDSAKGALAVVVALLASGYKINWLVAGAAVAVILGHCFPIWLRFRGGKGVATGVGVFLVLAPIALGGSALVFLAIVWWIRYVSLGSIAAAVALPLFVLLQNILFKPIAGFENVEAAAFASALLIVFMHRGNIGRLRNGTESKFR